MTLRENRRWLSVAEERETSRAASSPEAIMRTGSRVYIGALLRNRYLSVFCASCGVGRGYVTAYLRQSEEGNREQKKSGLKCAHRDSTAAANIARQHIKEYFLL